jgi:hypothetical protein
MLLPSPNVVTELSIIPKPKSAGVPSSTKDSERIATSPPKSLTINSPSGSTTGSVTSVLLVV